MILNYAYEYLLPINLKIRRKPKNHFSLAISLPGKYICIHYFDNL